LFRFSHYDALQLYQHYNMDHDGWPHNLPPPPNPDKLRSFVMWCMNTTITQMNEENDPKSAQNAEARDRRQMTP